MPRQPRWIDKVNFIRFYASNMCNFPWVVYFETALPALGRAIMVLFEFDQYDLARSIFRPAGVRTGRHGRKRPRRRGRKPLIPEISDVVADRIPGKQVIATRQVSQGVRNLWFIDSVGQRLLYYWMIIDVVTEFGFQWYSAIVLDERSRCPFIRRAMRLQIRHTHLGTSTYTAAPIHGVEYEEPDPFTTSLFVTVPPGMKMWMTLSGTARNARALPGAVNVGLQIHSDQTGDFNAGSEDLRNPGDEAQLVAAGMVTGPDTLFYRIRSAGGPSEWDDLTMTVMQMSD